MFRDDEEPVRNPEDRIAPPPAAVWERVLRRLRAELGEDVYTSWFNRLELQAVSGGVAQLTVSTRFLKSWIESHYADRILSHCRAEDAGILRLAITVRSASSRGVARPAGLPAAPRASETPLASAEKAAPAAAENAAGEPATAANALDRRYSFSTFLVGKSNAMARAAAEKVATTQRPLPHYNPLTIHAGVGLGKTHLLQAMAQAAEVAGRRVTYLSADAFMYGFAASLRSQTALVFKERIRNIDLLILDDVQFLQGKSFQQEFCHTLNALLDAAGSVVVAADRPPGDLESLDERLRSRLKGGLVVEMEPLDEELRRRILDLRIAAARHVHPGFEVSPAVVDHVAKRITTNGRDLDGAVNRLLAQVTLTATPLSVETAEAAIRDLVMMGEPKRVKIEDIQKLVAVHFNVSRADILSSRRTENVVRPRQIAMYLSKVLTPRSLPEIGRRFGGRDHTTVLHAVRKIAGLVDRDDTLKETIERLRRMLSE